MFWLIHLLAGIIIGSSINSIILVIALSLLSHFIIDSIPHWDGYFDKKKFEKSGKINKIDVKKTDIKIKSIDLILSLFFFLFFYIQLGNKLIFLGAFFALLPDFMKIGYLTKLKDNQAYLSYLRFHSKIQGNAKILTGIVIQGIILFFLMAVLLQNYNMPRINLHNPMLYLFKFLINLIIASCNNFSSILLPMII